MHTTASDTRARIHGLTGLRGIASLLVVGAHMNLSSFVPSYTFLAGELGVAVFFCLSGFLMALIYLREPWNRGIVFRFGLARFARIAPVYLTTVIISFLVVELVDPHFVYPITLELLPRHLLFSGNVSVMWSIAPEVQFYVLFIGLWAGIFFFHQNVYLHRWRSWPRWSD